MEYTTEMPGTFDSLGELHALFDRAKGGFDGFSPTDDRYALIRLAVHEAFTNVVRHAYKGMTEHAVGVCLQEESGGLTVTLLDDGVRFNPREDNTDPEGPARSMGGLGMRIIRSTANRWVYDVTPDGRNRLQMFFAPDPPVAESSDGFE